MKKTSIIPVFLLGTILSSCSETSQQEVYEIETLKHDVITSNKKVPNLRIIIQIANNGTTIAFSLVKKNQSISMLNKKTSNITWKISGSAGGTWADNKLVIKKGLPSCTNGSCSEKSISSAWNATNEGILSISVEGNLVDDDGNNININNQQTNTTLSITPITIYLKSIELPLAQLGSDERPDFMTAEYITYHLTKNHADKINGTLIPINQSSIKLTCHKGYGWPENAQIPSWGSLSEYNDFKRLVSKTNIYVAEKLQYMNSNYAENTSKTYWGWKYNNFNDTSISSLRFQIGCWPIAK